MDRAELLQRAAQCQSVTDAPIYRSWGDDPLPSRDLALSVPLRSFPSWYFRTECGKCGCERYIAETYLRMAGTDGIVVRHIILRLWHEGCGGEPHLVELITGILGVHPHIRRIVLVDVRPQPPTHSSL